MFEKHEFPILDIDSTLPENEIDKMSQFFAEATINSEISNFNKKMEDIKKYQLLKDSQGCIDAFKLKKLLENSHSNKCPFTAARLIRIGKLSDFAAKCIFWNSLNQEDFLAKYELKHVQVLNFLNDDESRWVKSEYFSASREEKMAWFIKRLPPAKSPEITRSNINSIRDYANNKRCENFTKKYFVSLEPEYFTKAISKFSKEEFFNYYTFTRENFNKHFTVQNSNEKDLSPCNVSNITTNKNTFFKKWPNDKDHSKKLNQKHKVNNKIENANIKRATNNNFMFNFLNKKDVSSKIDMNFFVQVDEHEDDKNHLPTASKSIG